MLCVVSIKLTPSTRRRNAGKPVNNLLTIVIVCWIMASGRVITSLSLALSSGFVVVEVLFVCFFLLLFSSFFFCVCVYYLVCVFACLGAYGQSTKLQ